MVSYSPYGMMTCDSFIEKLLLNNFNDLQYFQYFWQSEQFKLFWDFETIGTIENYVNYLICETFPTLTCEKFLIQSDVKLW